MEIDKTQSKRKTELDSEPRKGKKSREDITDGSKEKGTLICFEFEVEFYYFIGLNSLGIFKLVSLIWFSNL